MGRRIKKKLFPGTLVAQMVKNLPAMWETQVPSLGREDPWRREWQPTPVFLPGEFPWTEEPGRLQSMGSQRVGHDQATNTSLTFIVIGSLYFVCFPNYTLNSE